MIRLIVPVLLLAANLGAKPNVVFMMADDLGWNDVGYHGSEIRTPNVDRLVAEGVELDRYYAFPVCSPTRAALMTGRSPIRLGVDRPIEKLNGTPLDEHFMSQSFQAAGYQTILSGKWHLGLSHVDYFPDARGFDNWYGHLGPMVDYNTHIWEGGLDWNRDGKVLEEPGYTTTLIGDEAASYLRERDKGKPTFLYVAFNAPHFPLQAPAAAVDEYRLVDDRNRKVYAAMVTLMDTAVGKILSTLRAEGMADDTIVVWVSDNGGALNAGASNGPLRNGKARAFEGGIRVPGVVRWPAELEPSKFEEQITVLDWLPTLAAAADVRLGSKKKLDGYNLWPALKSGKKVERGPTVIGMMDTFSVFHDGWKYLEDKGRGETETLPYLFRILEDPNEENNLVTKHPDVVEEMTALLRSVPRTPTVSPDFPPPAEAGAGRGGKKGAKKKRPVTAGWSRITGPPWLERAKRE